MIPNVFPAMVVFGTMGWASLLVDVGAMMTASVALGIAVDDTLHYLTWFRREIDGGRSRPAAIIEAFLRCAPAMTRRVPGGMWRRPRRRVSHWHSPG
jgi:predicted RND superfamily exporter protein